MLHACNALNFSSASTNSKAAHIGVTAVSCLRWGGVCGPRHPWNELQKGARRCSENLSL